MVNTVSKTDNDDVDSSMYVLSKQIKEEARKLPHSKNEYNVIENENLMDEFSETLMTPIFEKKFTSCYDRKYCDLCGDKMFYKIAIGIFSSWKW